MLNKAELILHPVRMRIILALTNQELTPLQLIDIHKTTAARQHRQILLSGVLQAVAQRILQQQRVCGSGRQAHTARRIALGVQVN